MMAEIEILQPGLFSSIQDLGRFGFQKFGVPQSGAMDRYAMRICNMLLGNPETASVLEITMLGPQIKFNGPASICITGADISPFINRNPVQNYGIIEIEEGDILKFSGPKTGFRSYIGIAGGFSSEKIMDSYSWYEGLTENFRLEKGMKLNYDSGKVQRKNTFSSLKIDTDYLTDSDIEVYPGPEFGKLTTSQKNHLFNSDFKLDENSNRMAVQMKEQLQNELEPIVTSPVLPGTVQLTPSGKIIALMRDCQTTGGYPRILQLSEKGIQVLAQKRPGEKVSFLKRDYLEF